ncbi:hypothetical protein DFH29DRAFT_1079426 [Suillus ampliporus]|nr:hypothetical protein DFH29DRAFT_1079426 [Suillus ampliporus]
MSISPLSNLQHNSPSPALPYAPSTPAEQLAADRSAAAIKIVAAAGQITNILQSHFYSCLIRVLYTPACSRFIEHLHIVDILHDAVDERQRLLSELRIIAELQSQSEPVLAETLDKESNDSNGYSANCLASRPSFTRDAPTEEKALQLEGVHVIDISLVIEGCMGDLRCVDSVRLAHPLRLLSTHHILRETGPDTFAHTRVPAFQQEEGGKRLCKFSCCLLFSSLTCTPRNLHPSIASRNIRRYLWYCRFRQIVRR